MHVPMTFHFLDLAFNENIHIYCFHQWDVFLIHLFYDMQNFNMSLLSLKEKRNFGTIFSKTCYAACTINHPGQLICLLASLHKHNGAGVIDKAARKNKVQ